MGAVIATVMPSFQLGADTFSISSMSLADVPEICAIESTIYDFPWTSGNFTDSLNAGYIGTVVRRAQGAENKGYDSAVIGYAMTMKLPDEVHLLNISVSKPFQGRGVGRAYLKALLNSARQLNAANMLLEVRPSNSAGIQLYALEGFRQVGVRKGYYPSLHDQREDALVFTFSFQS